MSRRTYTYNAFETTLTGDLNTGVTTAAVVSTTGLTAPMYVVLDPDIPAKREWIKVGSIGGSSLENLTRNLTGSVGDITHLSGATVRAVFVSQMLDDIFSDILDHEGLSTAHHTKYTNTEAVNAMGAKANGNALNHDRYTDADAAAKVATDDLYVKNTGDNMAGVQALASKLIRNVTVSVSAPGSPVTGDLWLDIS